jgi:hypothetical protein
LNLNFQADIAQVNIMAQNATGDNIVIYTSASGSTGTFGGSNIPVQISFSNQTVGNTLTVNSKVSTSGNFGTAAKVTCDIYLNPDLFLNVNVTTDTGQINLNETQQATFQSLTLKSTTGEVKTDLQNGTTIAGEMSIKSTTGTVTFTMNQTKVVGNHMFNVQTTTGNLDMQFEENQAFGENLQVNASSNTGEIDLSVNLNNDAGAKIQPQTDAGQINTNLNNFSDNNSLIESYNYPAQTNFLISLQTNVGSININAAYESSAGPIISN